VLVYEPSPGKMTELFQSGQANNRGVGHRAACRAFANTGLPGRLHLSEGRRRRSCLAFGLPGGQGVGQSARRHEMIKTLLSASVQTGMAKEMGNGPGQHQGRRHHVPGAQ